MAYLDKNKARAADRDRSRRKRQDRLARGVCVRCGKVDPLPGRPSCAVCDDRKRELDRARHERGRARPARDRARQARQAANGKANGKLLYGGRDPVARRKSGRKRWGKLTAARRASGLCERCGVRSPVEGGSTCGACRERRQAAERKLYAARRAAWRCTRCGDPSQGAARCLVCAERQASAPSRHRVEPAGPAGYTMIELSTGAVLGTFDTWEDVAAQVAFSRLSWASLEILCDG